MLRYHSIAHDRSVQAVDAVYLPYRPPQLIQAPEVQREEHGPKVAFFRAVPQDGRIKLPFDIHWERTWEVFQRKKRIFQRMQDYYYWESFSASVTLKPAPIPFHEEMEAVLALLAWERSKSQKKANLESFFGGDFRDHGQFSVHDVDPSTMATVVFRSGGKDPATAIVKKPTDNQCKGKGRDIEETTMEHADIFNWMATQEMFCSINPSIRGIAPWQRIIRCQGLELTPKLDELNLRFPLLDFRMNAWDELEDPVEEAGKSYFAGECRSGTESANPYDVPTRAFHLVFFERFSDESRFAAEEGEIDTRPTSRQTAELACIVYALRTIVKKWHEFDDYIGSLLTEDFMDPAQYCQLLFDDAKFSRSRLYFWTLGCLNEFDVILEDSILQWKLYQLARVNPILYPSPVPDETVPSASAGKAPSCVFDLEDDRIRLGKLNEQAQNLVSDLEALRKRFKAKKDRVQILRDGLFNASALMESRSSTRLGMNVQLLTYVSIFYLPLAFCASLWAIPSITSPHTQTAFVVTAVLVAFATYMTVFNLENLVRLPWYLYSRLKNLTMRAVEDYAPFGAADQGGNS
ncbi:corA-like mg2+ transporter protein domain-containing protein [Cordyceps javanica]|nr:corA-like mg2+ transporter protein domain-containing protein [Cordyceps javanica]